MSYNFIYRDLNFNRIPLYGSEVLSYTFIYRDLPFNRYLYLQGSKVLSYTFLFTGISNSVVFFFLFTGVWSSVLYLYLHGSELSIPYLYLQGVEIQFYTFIYRNLQFRLILLYGVELLNLINPTPLYYQYLLRNITKK